MTTIQCLHCGAPTAARRKTRKYCSNRCATRHKGGWSYARLCRQCGQEFRVETRGDANRQYCSNACAKKANAKTIQGWKAANPQAMAVYNQARKARDPECWKRKQNGERLAILTLLGGRCLVCGADNPNWLHADYIPTTRGTPYRHPRHLAFVREHLDQFRLLCANHHYELTLTGRIEGTEIEQ